MKMFCLLIPYFGTLFFLTFHKNMNLQSHLYVGVCIAYELDVFVIQNEIDEEIN